MGRYIELRIDLLQIYGQFVVAVGIYLGCGVNQNHHRHRTVDNHRELILIRGIHLAIDVGHLATLACKFVGNDFIAGILVAGHSPIGGIDIVGVGVEVASLLVVTVAGGLYIYSSAKYGVSHRTLETAHAAECHSRGHHQMQYVDFPYHINSIKSIKLLVILLLNLVQHLFYRFTQQGV